MFQPLSMDIPETPVITVTTTQNRGFTPEEVADRCVNKLIAISDNANPLIRDQAHAFKKQLHTLISFYMREAIKSDRTTVCNALVDAGHPELAKAIRRL